MTVVARALASFALGLALLVACGPKPGDEKVGRGVLVIAIDALRADHLSSYGYDRRTTPYLDALSQEGVEYTQAFSAAPEILPAHAAILTGCEPMLARRIPLGEPSGGTAISDWYVPDEMPRLSQEFLAQGFATAAFADHPAISPVCGFGAGFQEFRGFRSERLSSQTDTGYQGLASRFMNWLSGLDASQDWFAYLHIDDLDRVWVRSEGKLDSFFEPRPELSAVPPVAMDDRVFFAVPRGRWSRSWQSLGQCEAGYDGALRDLDQNLGRFFEGVRRMGRWADTTVVVVGTYGLGFGESGVIADTGTFSDCDLHVPVIVRPATTLGASLGVVRGVKTAQLFSLMDLAPTLLDLHGFPAPASMRGVSQAGALRGRPGAAREIAFASGGLQAGFVAIDARWCYEESSPGALEQEAASPLSLSWYGDAGDHRKDVRTFLHDRGARPSSGHLEGSASDAAASARLSAAGREYYDWIEKARAVLQAGPGGRAGFDRVLLEELARRGLLGEK
jgi:arylsulfatase A-like enzyme